MVKVVQVDSPLNGPEFKKAVMNAKEKLVQSNQTLEQTNPALFHEFVEYMASVKKISFADWQAVHGGLPSLQLQWPSRSAHRRLPACQGELIWRDSFES